MRVFEAIAPAAHGGDIVEVARRYSVDPARLLDFSANVNPAGPPREVRDAIARSAQTPAVFTHYPESQPRALREALARRHGIDPDCIVIGNGASALIDAAVRTFAPRACVIPVPAFSEYRRVLAAARVELVRYELDAAFDFDETTLLARLERAGATLAIVTNPHNPSGKLVERKRIERLIDACSRREIVVLLDEAFIDYVPDASAIGWAVGGERCIVIRSLTKFYGMPGIRVGYAAASRAIAKAVASRLPSWSTSALDVAAATAVIGAKTFGLETITSNLRSRERLAAALDAIGIRVFPSSANFLLLELPCGAGDLDGVLAQLVCEHHIVVRDCRSYDGLEERALIRVAVRTPEQNERLIAALSQARHLRAKGRSSRQPVVVAHDE
jgi:threonine-phosphate decarboxylase